MSAEQRTDALNIEPAELAELSTRLGQGIVVIDASFAVRWCNQVVVSDNLGSSPLGQSVHTIVCGSGGRCRNCPVERALKARRRLEVPVMHPVHGAVTRRIVASLLPQDKDGARSMLVQYEDIISEGTLPDASLLDAEQRYRNLVEHMAEGLTIVDQEEYFIVANPAAEATFGVQPGDLVGRNLAEFCDSQQFEQVKRQTAQRRSGLTSTYALTINRPDGRQRVLQLTASPYIDGHGRFIGAFTLFLDVSDRLATEQALAGSEEKYRNLVETSSDLIWSVDTQGRWTYVNQLAAGRMFGYEPGEMLGRVFSDFLAPDRVEQDLETFQLIQDGATYIGYETTLIRKDGTRVDLSFNAMSLRDEAGQATGTTGTATDITERKRAESALRESEANFRQLYDNSPVMLLSIDERGVLCNVNRKCLDKLGYQRDEVLGKRVDTFISAEYSSRIINEFIPKFWRDGQIQNVFARFVRADGAEIDAMIDAVAISDAVGRRLSIMVLSDITERRRAEYQLLKSEERYRSLVESMGEGIATFSAEESFVFANPATERIFGVSSGELNGRTLREFTGTERLISPPPAEDPNTLTLNQQELNITRPDGAQRSILVNAASPLYDDDGQFSGAIVLLQDTTERKQTQESLTRLYTAIEQAGECVVVTDPANRIVYVNPAFERITGVSRMEALGQSGRFLFSDREQDSPEDLNTKLARGEGWSGRIAGTRPDGSTFEVETTISAVRDTEGNITNYVSVYRDVTRELSLQAQLQQAQKMEAVGQMAGGIAHEFNNLLTAIIGNLSLAELEEPGSEQARSSMREAADAAQKSADLTRQLLLFSRKTPGKFNPVNINEVGQAAAKLAKHSFRPDLQFELQLDLSCASVKGEPTLLHQVVMNLLLNARDASPDGGTITLSTSPVEMERGSAMALPPGRPGRFVMVEVSDTGSGMAPDVASRIFEPFYTTKAAGQGTGLGLAVVYSIIQQHQGWITVTSEVGQGTQFRLFLPCTDEATQKAQAPRGAERGQGQVVLVIEDDALVAQMLEQALIHHGYRVYSAMDGTGALNQFRELQGEVDLILADVTLPGMSGVEIWHALRRENPKLRCLFISGHTPEEELQDVLAKDKVPFLAKPFRADEILRAVHRTLQSVAGGV